MSVIKTIRILNPAAGKGKALEIDYCSESTENYVTTGVADAAEYVHKESLADKDAHFVVCGGDGTLNEVVNGIMHAGTNDTVKISVIPTGSGNDFVKNFPIKGVEKRVDAMKYNDRYGINVINIGFDGKVAANVNKYKRVASFNGSLAYIMSVVEMLFKPLGEEYEITITHANGDVTQLAGNYLLAVVANGAYYGGGFKAAPLAELDDGLLEVILVKKISRLTFIKLVADYRRGTHLDPETKRPITKMADYIYYTQCRRIKIQGMTEVCVDGEMDYISEVDISVIPDAINFVS